MTTRKNQPGCFHRLEQLHGITENLDITFSINLNALGDCTVALDRIQQEKPEVWEVKHMYFGKYSDACEWIKKQAELLCKRNMEQIAKEQREIEFGKNYSNY